MPWISRRDLDRLYSLVEKALDHRSRVERAEAGLSEVPPPPRKSLGLMPPEVARWIATHDSKTVRDRLRKEALQRAKSDGSWEGVLADIPKEET